MRILNSESFKKITPLLRDNYGNLHAQISLKLPPDMAAMFAHFTLQPSTGGAQWSVTLPEEDELQPLSKASDLERDQISVAIKRLSATVAKEFPAQAAKIIEVPDNDSIFYCYNGSRLQVVLTQWGFRRVRAQKDISVIRLCLERAEVLSDSSVTLRIINADGSPAANQDFVLLIFNNEISFTTDAMGLYNVGHLRCGSKFRVQLPTGAVSDAFTVDKDREFYDVRLPAPPKPEPEPEDEPTKEPEPPKEPEPQPDSEPEPSFPVRVRILDKKDRPQGLMPVTVYCQRGYEQLVTDRDGYITLNSSDLMPGETPRIELIRPKSSARRSKKKLNDSPKNNPNTPPKP